MKKEISYRGTEKHVFPEDLRAAPSGRIRYRNVKSGWIWCASYKKYFEIIYTLIIYTSTKTSVYVFPVCLGARSDKLTAFANFSMLGPFHKRLHKNLRDRDGKMIILRLFFVD